MNVRKVIKNQNGAFSVTLPIDYCRRHNLTGDSYVSAIEHDGKLEIAPIVAPRQE